MDQPAGGSCNEPQEELMEVEKVAEKPTDYGNLEGQESVYVKLISSDGHEFIVKRELAIASGTIQAMLDGPGLAFENEVNEVYLSQIPSHILSLVCKYFNYKKSNPSISSGIAEFTMDPKVSLELLLAANFLEV